ncbi:acyl carrier protein [Streptomyces niger]|uniref:acyl carrier protein n=1 Tax=Streptomyces niger TaxID=66373 RepID=UPI00069A476C|nr:acyl carrier protein [Streptomyces niger]
MTEQEFIDALSPLMEEITGTGITGDRLDDKFSDFDLDSLNQVEIISRIEDSFDCEIEDATLRSISSPRQLMEAVRECAATR